MDAQSLEPRTYFRQARILHTMLRVADLDASIDFYTRLLGMKLLRRSEHPEGEYTLAFLGYGDESESAVLELTYNWDRKEAYELGDGYGHVAIGVADIRGACDALAAEGVEMPTPPKQRSSGNWIAFVRDPDGYKIELIQRAGR